MVEELPANGADEPLRRSVLPGTLECRALRMKTEPLDHLSYCGAENRIVVVDQKVVARSLGEGIAQPLAYPLSRWTRGDVEEKKPTGTSRFSRSPIARSLTSATT